MFEWLKGDFELKRTKKRGWVIVDNDAVDMHLSHELFIWLQRLRAIQTINYFTILLITNYNIWVYLIRTIQLRVPRVQCVCIPLSSYKSNNSDVHLPSGSTDHWIHWHFPWGLDNCKHHISEILLLWVRFESVTRMLWSLRSSWRNSKPIFDN